MNASALPTVLNRTLAVIAAALMAAGCAITTRTNSHENRPQIVVSPSDTVRVTTRFDDGGAMTVLRGQVWRRFGTTAPVHGHIDLSLDRGGELIARTDGLALTPCWLPSGGLRRSTFAWELPAEATAEDTISIAFHAGCRHD